MSRQRMSKGDDRAPNLKTKDVQQAEIDKQKAEYFANGGRTDVLEYNPAEQPKAKMGDNEGIL